MLDAAALSHFSLAFCPRLCTSFFSFLESAVPLSFSTYLFAHTCSFLGLGGWDGEDRLGRVFQRGGKRDRNKDENGPLGLGFRGRLHLLMAKWAYRI